MADVIQNPNDYKVVSFHNSTDFGFTPEMGCMYDGRPINGKTGSPGIEAGETVILPYHIGHQLALNLAKRVLNTSKAALVDQAGVPTGVPIWSATRLEEEKNKFIAELYSEAKAAPQSQTDLLMAKVEEYKSMVDTLLNKDKPEAPVEIPTDVTPNTESVVFQDKQEVLAELEKREIKHDKRKSKQELEKLLV